MPKPKMNFRYFGSCPAGDVMQITIRDGSGIYAELLSLGAALRTLKVPDREGKTRDVVLGYETAEEYWENDGYLGAVIGRNCNRIGGAAFTLNGIRCELSANVGTDQLHGGVIGFSHQIWTPVVYENKAVFRLMSPDGDQGFPGNLSAEVTYSLETPGELKISYRAYSDQDTVVNMTNHAYFNLAGQESGPVDAQLLSVSADAYTPLGQGLIPTGEIRPVDGRPEDIRKSSPLSRCFDDPAFAATNGLDHNYVLNHKEEVSARLYSAESGISMEVITDRPAMQVYSAGVLTERKGKNGAVYGLHHALCLETQAFPDAVNHDNFPTTVLKAGEEFFTETVYRFRTAEE